MSRDFRFVMDGQTREITLETVDGGYEAKIGDQVRSVQVVASARGLLVLRIEGKTVEIAHGERDGVSYVATVGRSFRLQDEAAAAGTADGAAGGGRFDGKVETPMPGKVVKVLVKEGEKVEAGQTLLIVEAMKMENRIDSQAAGTVRSVHVREGDNVSFGQVLVEIEPAEG